MNYQVEYKSEKVGTVAAEKLFEKLDSLKESLEGMGFECKKSSFANGKKLVASYSGEEITEYSVVCSRWTTTMYITDLVAFKKVQEAAA
jgi:hypothetical protein